MCKLIKLFSVVGYGDSERYFSTICVKIVGKSFLEVFNNAKRQAVL